MENFFSRNGLQRSEISGKSRNKSTSFLFVDELVREGDTIIRMGSDLDLVTDTGNQAAQNELIAAQLTHSGRPSFSLGFDSDVWRQLGDTDAQCVTGGAIRLSFCRPCSLRQPTESFDDPRVLGQILEHRSEARLFCRFTTKFRFETNETFVAFHGPSRRSRA